MALPRRVRAESLTADRIDYNARTVVQRLRRFGFEAYLVGGCVRDLLLGRTPKDFDIATDARPRQVKRVFRNCRIIGRRFKLAHVVFGDRVIETATFRRRPQGLEDEGGDLLITDDNLFGNAEEDALRRDFTINGLFFDTESGEVIDYVGGLDDLERLTLRTIGDPWVRFREDPVRILRAIKFAARLGFQLEPEMWRAMTDLAPEIARGAPPRVLEEIYRLMRSGTALGALRLLADCGALRTVLPEIADFLESEEATDEGKERVQLFWRYLEALDSVVHETGEPSNALIASTLFVHLIRRESDPSRRRAPGPPPQDPGQVVDDVLAPVCQRLRLSRNDAGRARRLVGALRRFLQKSRKRSRPGAFLRQDYFLEALALLRIHCTAEGSSWHIYEAWLARRERAGEGPEPPRPADGFDRDRGPRDGRRDPAAEPPGIGERIPEPAASSPAPSPGRDFRPHSRPPGPFQGRGPGRNRRRGRRRRRGGGGPPMSPPGGSFGPPAAPPPPRPKPAEDRTEDRGGWGADW